MYTQNVSIRSIQARVVGVTFEGRQTVVSQLQVGETVLLVRDPYNPYDPSAVKVLRQNGHQIGFLDRYLAAELSSQLDHKSEPVKAIVLEITGGYYPGLKLGVLIRFDLAE